MVFQQETLNKSKVYSSIFEIQYGPLWKMSFALPKQNHLTIYWDQNNLFHMVHLLLLYWLKINWSFYIFDAQLND
jgi:hypothetical protein